MVINERCIKILTILSKTKDYNLRKLSENFSVHQRTIRYDIDNLNYILKSYNFNKIEKLESGSFYVNLKNSELSKIVDQFGKISFENRKSYLKIIFFSKELLSVNKTMKALDVSRSTIKKDLETIKEEFENIGIELIELPTKNYKINANEEIILKEFEKELLELITDEFFKLPSVLKKLIKDLTKDIKPILIENKMYNLSEDNQTLFNYSKIFCYLMALNSRKMINNTKDLI